MRLIFVISLVFIWSCGPRPLTPDTAKTAAMADFTIAFGSCNDQDRVNVLWPFILDSKPDVWIWGGDNVYADTDNMTLLRANYRQVYEDTAYARLRASTHIMGTWDDHDYGENDGGVSFAAKAESKMELLRFLDASEEDERYDRPGVYYSEVFTVQEKTINIIILDTRYFRTGLTASINPDKRYKPNEYGEGTILGVEQWAWLRREFERGSDYNIVMSSVQVLSGEHGYETWGNFPHELDALLDLIAAYPESRTILLSGDRHIAEISAIEVPRYPYPVYDFTASGMTHAYTSFTGEPNKQRIGDVFHQKNFGLLTFDLAADRVLMEVIDENGHQAMRLKAEF